MCANRCMPYPLISAIIDGEVNNFHKGNNITVTSVIGCLRKTFLERTTPYYQKLSSLWYSSRGSWMHKVLEGIEGDVRWITEKRFFCKFQGVEVSGQIDSFDKYNGHLYDYKTTLDKNVEYIEANGPKNEHVLQTSTYAYMMRQEGM
jgi:hypothetical protein